MSVTVTVKGQVTIPKPVREHLGIRPGTAVEFVLDAEGGVQLRKVGGRAPVSRFARARGRATAGLSTDQIMALTRREDWRECPTCWSTPTSCWTC